MFQIQNNTEKHVSQATLKPSSLFSLIFSQSANQLKTLKAFISNELIELNNYAESSDKAKMYSFFTFPRKNLHHLKYIPTEIVIVRI